MKDDSVFYVAGLLDALSPTANLWLPMVPSTQAKIPSRSCPPHDPAVDRFLPAYDRELNGLGGGLLPSRAYGGSRCDFTSAPGTLSSQ